MRRPIAPEEAKRSPESSNAESKPLSAHDEIRLRFRLDRVDRQGFSQQHRRYREIEPIDELFGDAGEESKDGEDRKPDEPSKED
jgi:hypothetical protein